MSRKAIWATAAGSALIVAVIAGYWPDYKVGVAQEDDRPTAATDNLPSPPTTAGRASHPASTSWDHALAALPATGDTGVIVGSGGVNWCDVFQSPDVASDRLAQALVGETVRVQQYRGTWGEVQAADGIAWSGWISVGCITRGQEDFRREIANGPWFVVLAAPVLRTALGDLPFGSVLPDVSEPGRPRVRLPDGRIVSVEANGVRARGTASLDEALKSARQFVRAPYQKGANTVEAMDATGLVQLVFRVAGKALPRAVDALQRAGQNVPLDQMLAGDVVFYGTFDTSQPHAVILLDNGRSFLEASPASGVNLGLVEQMRNRSIVAVRRYVPAPRSTQ